MKLKLCSERVGAFVAIMLFVLFLLKGIPHFTTSKESLIHTKKFESIRQQENEVRLSLLNCELNQVFHYTCVLR